MPKKITPNSSTKKAATEKPASKKPVKKAAKKAAKKSAPKKSVAKKPSAKKTPAKSAKKASKSAGRGRPAGPSVEGANPLAKVLKKLRGDQSQAEFAEAVGLRHAPAIARLESPDYHGATVRTMLAIAEATGTELVIQFRKPK